MSKYYNPEYHHLYREAHREKRLEYARQLRAVPGYREAHRLAMKERYWRKRDELLLKMRLARHPDLDYRGLLVAQRGVCAGCGKPETAKHQSGVTKTLAVDHDHVNGQVRGLLCQRCNRALGLVGDNASTLRALADYLESAERGAA